MLERCLFQGILIHTSMPVWKMASTYHPLSQNGVDKFPEDIASIVSTGERPFIDILQDRRYWLIHLITIPSLFICGVIFILSGFVYKLFGVLFQQSYFERDNCSISLIKDRFCIFSSIDDIL